MERFLSRNPNYRMVARLVGESFWRHAPAYGVAIVAMLLVAGTTGASAWMMQLVTDNVLTSTSVAKVNLVALAVATIFIVKGLATYTQAVALSRAGNAIIAERQRKIYDRMLQHGIEFYHAHSSSDLVTRLTVGASAARGVLDTLVTTFVRDLFSLIGLIVVMVVQQPLLSVIALVIGPLAFFLVSRLLRRTRKLMEREMLSMAQIVQVLQETVFGVRIVKSFRLEERMRAQMNKAISDVERRSNSMVAIEAISSPIMETLAGLTIAGVIVMSGILVVERGQSPGSIMAFITAVLLAYEPAKRIARTRISLEGGLVGVRMMYEMADRPLTLHEYPDARPLAEGPGEIRFEHVDFSYREDVPTLRDFDLVLPAGRMTALVGASGGGKSTVINLLMRMYDPQSGRVLIDGEDIKYATFESLRAKIAYVSQDTFLFTGDVMSNIRMGRLDAGDEEVIAAARAANAHDFIMALPQGYGTPVGENGALLSGGQRQRLSIARAILRKSQILLLDEATSALDAESESLFRDALDHLRVGRTVVVVAHRLSTVHQADNIVVMERGRVIEQGRHPELVRATDGAYRKLYDYQLLP